MSRIKIIVTGASGRMGQAIIKAVTEDQSYSSQFLLVGAIVSKESDKLNKPVPGADIHYQSDMAPIISKADVVIDFSTSEASTSFLSVCQQYGKKLLIGTTGFSDLQKEAIHQAATKLPILFAPNTSVGITVLCELLKKAAELVGDSADIQVLDIHHRHKKDAPSGTAKQMKSMLEEGLSLSRHNEAENKVSVTSIRAGDVVGEHTAMLLMNGERIELTHKATERALFAHGALKAAAWLNEVQEPGCYTMRQVLNLS